MKHSHGRHHHHHHHRDTRPSSPGTKDTRPSSPRTKDSRPRPLQIPNRRSDVRSLIDFFNNRAFKEDGRSAAPRRPRDPIPENKVKSLVVNFNRLESFSAPISGQTTAQVSPIKQRFEWKERAEQIPKREVLAGKRINVIVQPEADVGGLEEIAVFGGDSREMASKKSTERLRSVKMKKEQFAPRTEERQSVDQAKEKKKRSHHHHRHHKDKSLKLIVPGGVDGQTASTDAAVNSPVTKPPSRIERRSSPVARPPSRTDKKSRTHDLKSNSPNNESERYFSSRSVKTSPVLSLKTDKDTPQPLQSKSSAPALPPKPPALKYASPVPQVRDANLRATTQEPSKIDTSNRYPKQPRGLGVVNRGQTEPSTPKYAGPGMVKGVVGLFAAPSRQDNVPPRGRTADIISRPLTYSDGRNQQNKVQRSRVPADYESSSGSSSSESESSGPSTMVNKTQLRGTPKIVTTEASPTALKAAARGEKIPSRDMPATNASYDYPTSTIRQPRTFKDIALERRKEREKGAQPSPPIPTAPRDHLSVPRSVSPLRVVKMQDTDVPTLQNPVPLHRLYSKASQDTLTSFEEPSILVSGSSESSEEDVPSPPPPPRQRAMVKSQRVRPSNSPIPPLQVAYRPPMRSPSLMREMAPPRLSIRTSSIKSTKSVKQSSETTSKVPRSKRPVVTKEHFEVTSPEHYTPRMKLKNDDEWRDKWRQRLKNNTIDGPNDSRELLRQGKRQQPRYVSSSSHNTTSSSRIVDEKRRILPLEAQTESESQSESQSSVMEDRQRQSDYTLISPAQEQRSKVNFSSFTQNFPAAEYSNAQGARQQRIDDRTTAFDGVQDVAKAEGVVGFRILPRTRAVDGGGVGKGVQEFEEPRTEKKKKLKTKKAYRDRPSRLG
ncbi:hypothetical protein BZA05DRAFT_394969 [Tricharina praecox]|uniref:uncharacterized protein n=1 Tax=Tricharina praecox TaxID=43433 RepID=UPI00221EA7D8|nr:uncharacterized protein BZA05DRAFT_394969 [Tricharina praecox]KAI5853879.1 hypothetical protein BZA05DRAFT_394969 [Tricharina praecox]